jgi:hypothetical protein
MPTLKCYNCGRILGCSCKRRTASDGKSCCTTCIQGYTKSLTIKTVSPEVKRVRDMQSKLN